MKEGDYNHTNKQIEREKNWEPWGNKKEVNQWWQDLDCDSFNFLKLFLLPQVQLHFRNVPIFGPVYMSDDITDDCVSDSVTVSTSSNHNARNLKQKQLN